MTTTRQESMPSIFSRHETFHLRYGWLKKGYDKASVDNEVFTKDDAPVVLGVGKNMVKAIRYWCYAFKVLDEKKSTASKGRVYIPSQLGEYIFDNAGWDPYLEDVSSLWLLHWNLLKQPCYATSWHFLFNEFHQHIFTANDILIGLKDYNDKKFPALRIAESSLTKDINCLLRMYVAQKKNKGAWEDSIDCPFVELGLIIHYGDEKHFSFNMGNKNGLADEIVVAACLDYASEIENSAKTIAVSRLLYEPGSPGLAFKLTESSLCHAVEQVAKKVGKVSLSETAGLIQFSFTEEPKRLSKLILNKFYM